MQSFFLLLYRSFNKKRILFFSMVIIGGFIAAYLASRITLEEDISKSMPGESDKISLVINNSRLTNKIILNIFLNDTTKAADLDKLITFSDELVDSLRNRNFSRYIDQSTLKISDSLIDNMMEFFYENIPLFLTENDYQKIDSLLLPETIDKTLEKNYKTLISPTSFALKKYILLDPIGISSLALNKLKQFQIEEGYGVQGGYIFTGNRKNLLLFIDPVNPPTETRKNAIFFKQLDKLLKVLSVKNDYIIKAEYYGSSAVAVSNAEQVKKDIALTVTISLVIILLFVGWFFRNAIIPFIGFLPAVFGGIAALALIYIIKAKMSTIALGIGSVLLGIIVDYALYIFSLYKAKGSIEVVIRDMSISIAMCSLTTAAAFFSLLFVKSEVLKDLGLFAGLSVLGAALFTLVILPHLIKMRNKPSGKGKLSPIDKIVTYKFESNKILIIGILVITVVFFFFSKKAGFETDMYSMNYLSLKMKEAEKHLNKINDISLKSVYIVSTGDNLDQALSKNAKVIETLDKLKNKDIVKKYTDVGTILINDSIQKERILRWKDYWSFEKRKKLENTMIIESAKYGFRNNAFNKFYDFLSKDIQPLDISRFSTIRSLFLNDMITETKDFSMVMSLVKVNNDDRHKVYTEFSGNNNSIVIDRQEITSGFVKSIRTDFDLLVKLCLILVTLIVILSYGRIETGIIASIPMYISWLWVLGFMAVFGIKFNIINIIVTTFVFGLGVDYSILMMRGLSLEYKYGHKELSSYKTSIFLSAFTTIIGVGVLLLAKHPSLNSIALVSVIGLLSVVLISYTIVPIMFRWLVLKNNKKRMLPVTLSDIIITMAVFALFVTGCLFMNMMLLLVFLLPIPSKNKHLLMHKGMVLWCKIPVYSMLHIKKKVVNPGGEDFGKPALIISNHQSHIDLLLLLMLHPKLIVLTTKWVWNNPIYALVIRYLNYYPVMEGYGDLTDKLKAKIDEGYSVIVFPEGSRSPDSAIRRFHKGAFLLADKLKLDLLPVFIHGAGDCMNKGENHLRGGSITIKIYPRVKPGDSRYGSDYHEMTKSMLSFYRSEYAKMKEELETPSYFRKKLIRNYIYKGPVLEWYTRIKLSLEGNYERINSLIPREARVVDIGCGYGYLSYLLSFVSPERKILGIDYDEGKIETANHCISKNSRIDFVSANASAYAFENADVFVLSDVLHYLPDDRQTVVLERCMEKLNANGKIIIRDADSDFKKRHRGTRYTEFFSTRSGFNKAGQNRLFFFSGRKIVDIAARHGFQTEIMNQSRLTSNMLFILRKK
jgi:1-acyl-sn-glycerol-3-phosphate acyltransferase